jgi:hypothetical protein
MIIANDAVHASGSNKGRAGPMEYTRLQRNDGQWPIGSGVLKANVDFYWLAAGINRTRIGE